MYSFSSTTTGMLKSVIWFLEEESTCLPRGWVFDKKAKSNIPLWTYSIVQSHSALEVVEKAGHSNKHQQWVDVFHSNKLSSTNTHISPKIEQKPNNNENQKVMRTWGVILPWKIPGPGTFLSLYCCSQIKFELLSVGDFKRAFAVSFSKHSDASEHLYLRDHHQPGSSSICLLAKIYHKDYLGQFLLTVFRQI